MGKMTFDVTCEMNVLIEYMNQLDFPNNLEEVLKTNLSGFGEILAFNSELDEGNKLKTICKINVSPDLVKSFEKWDKWEFTRMMEKELRLTFNEFGQVIDFRNGIDYDNL